MKLGVCVPNYGETCSRDAIRTIATEAERSGYDSVWCTDHILMPRNSGTPYERIFDSITTLAYLAAATTKLKLGISSLITPMRNPVVVAKQLVTIDNLSNGRVMLATSVGWNETEFSHLGSNFHNRGKRLDESIRLIRDLWSGKTDFESKILRQKFHDAVFEPPPVQQRLTIWIGGTSPAAMKRAATLGDGWHPNAQPLDKFAKLVSDFKKISQDAKRKEISVRIGLNSKADNSEYLSAQGERRIMLSSNRVENRKVMEDMETLGVSYAVLVPSPDGKISFADQLDGLRMIAEDFL
jgi:probable F420-dependent oxidoreductase